MKKRSLAAIGLLPLMLFLTACEKTDGELAMDFMNSWLEARGAMSKNKDGSYSPTVLGAAAATGWGTTGNTDADAAMQAGKITKDIAETDKIMKEGEAAYGKNPPDLETAKEKADKAVDARPNDWYYRNHRAYMDLDQGNTSQAQADLKAGVDGCGGNQVCLGALYRDRTNFYAGYTLSAFMAADTRMRTNCAVHTMGVETFQALIALGQTTYQSSLLTAQEQKKNACG